MVTWLLIAALAQVPPAAPPPDLSAMGPASRKAKHEAQDRKEIDALFKALDAALEKGDAAAYADTLDFPVTLVTDGATGSTFSVSLDREAFLKAVSDSMKPVSHLKVSSKRTVAVLSDALATVVDDTTMTLGKTKGLSKSGAVVVRHGDAWKIKVLTEPGWAELLAPPVPPSP